jgi:hypothetical protein
VSEHLLGTQPSWITLFFFFRKAGHQGFVLAILGFELRASCWLSCRQASHTSSPTIHYLQENSRSVGRWDRRKSPVALSLKEDSNYFDVFLSNTYCTPATLAN